MKNTLTVCVAAALIGGALSFPGFAPAQLAGTVTTTTTTSGTISEFGPDALVIRSTASADPLRYSFSEKTVYVDETGAPVAREVLRAGIPVTVHYTQAGNSLLADRVVVMRTAAVPAPPIIEERTTTTTTTVPVPSDNDDDVDD